jgi:hypothetical protein
MSSDERLLPYDGSLPGAHSYLGLKDENRINFPPYTLLPSGTKIECPLLASKFCIFPGEILPIYTDDPDVVNLLSRVQNSETGFVFHLARESDEDQNKTGVLLKLTHFKSDDDGTYVAKFQALQIFNFSEIRLGRFSFDPFIFNMKVVGEAVKEDLHNLVQLACDPKWLDDQRRNIAYPRPLLRFLTYNNWDKLKEKILRYYLSLGMNECFAKEKLEEDPAFVSYFLVCNVPMTVKEKIELFGRNIENRIRHCIHNLVGRFISMKCKRHNCLLAKPEDFIFVSHAGICQLFVNPAGYYFNVVTVRSSHLALGTSENTWYPNYNWGYLLCGCERHHGWGYSSLTYAPKMFAAIHFQNCILNRMPFNDISEEPKPFVYEDGQNDWTVLYDGY